MDSGPVLSCNELPSPQGSIVPNSVTGWSSQETSWLHWLVSPESPEPGASLGTHRATQVPSREVL